MTAAKLEMKLVSPTGYECESTYEAVTPEQWGDVIRVLEGALSSKQPAEESDAELALRSLASWLGVGGYNAPKVDAKVFEQKIRDGVEMLHGKPETLQTAVDKWVTDAGNASVKHIPLSKRFP